MAESSPDSSQKFSSILTLILPVALVFLVLQKTFPLLLMAGTGVGIWQIWQRRQRQQQQQQATLDEIFYHLIQQHQGKITTLDLAMITKLPPQAVQDYLDQRAAEFSAQFEITENGGMIYHFQSVNHLKTEPQNLRSAAVDNVELFPVPPKTQPQKAKSLPIELNQSDLAKRFNVHPSTIRNWKHKPQFQQWSAEKDPDSITWQYSPKTRKFYPLI